MDGSYYERSCTSNDLHHKPGDGGTDQRIIDHIGLVNSIEDVYQEVSGSSEFSGKICYLK